MNGRDIITGLVVVVLWGLNFIVIKTGLQEIPPLLLGALRFLALSLPAIFFFPRPPVPWRWLIALGLTLNAAQFAFLFLGMKLGMPAGLASLLLQSQAFFTLLIAAVFLGKRCRWYNMAGLALAAGGITLIGSHQSGSITTAGFFLTLLAAVFWGAGNVITRRITQMIPLLSMPALVVWAGSIAILPLGLLSWFVEGPAVWQATWHHFTWTAAAAVLYLAYIATLCGFSLWNQLLSRHPATEVAPLSLLVPVIGMSSSALLLDESLSLWQALGSALVLAGLFIHVFGEKRGRTKPVTEMEN